MDLGLRGRMAVQMHKSRLLATLAASVALAPAAALDNGVALTPPRGFSTWNAFPVHSIDEDTSRRYMQGLIKAGLNKLNYTYFVVDEPCFAGREADGTLIENKTTWPNGLKAFGEELRSHGMALGVYTCVGPTTCGGCIASQGHEDQDVKTFAEWGVEYLKVDSEQPRCAHPRAIAPPRSAAAAAAAAATEGGVSVQRTEKHVHESELGRARRLLEELHGRRGHQ